MNQHCQQYPSSLNTFSHVFVKYHDDEEMLGRVREVLPESLIDHYMGYGKMMSWVFRANFVKAVFEIYGPMMLILSITPLTCKLSFHLMRPGQLTGQSLRKIAASLVISALVAFLYVATPE